MGFLKAIISIALGFYILDYIDKNKEQIRQMPVVGNQIYELANRNKDTLAVFAMGLVNLLL